SNYSQGIISGEIVECGLGNPEDFEGKDLNGKIALIQRGITTFSQKAKAATEAGAKGVIIYNNTSGIVNGSLDSNNSFVPTVGISQEDGQSIIAKINNNEKVIVDLEIKAPEKITSWNVIATKKPETKGNKVDKNDSDDIVHVTAHYDSVLDAPGANDNASGTAAMIEIAKSMNTMDIDKEIRFIACGAEEVGLRGSRAYVNSLSEDEVKRSVANFNLDMVATAYEACSELAVYTNDGKENLVTEAMKESESKLSHKSTEYVSYDGTFDGPMGSSDHVPFNEAGIPSALFINVDPAKKDDPRSALEPYYHKPTDYTGNVSEERLERSIELVGLAILNTVNVD
ncbi:MAG: M20/M25/M40 family metallo-hydrolase, partial [Peptostreptococcaceae bacterium]